MALVIAVWHGLVRQRPSGLRRGPEFTADVASSFHPSGFRAMARASAEADLRDVLPTVDVPTLILHGDVQAFLNQ